MASERSCLICGVAEAEVLAVRKREGYTLGCGLESNTEAGFDYEELSPRHRWKPWSDRHLAAMGIKPEAFEKYRTAVSWDIQYAACEDLVRIHVGRQGRQRAREPGSLVPGARDRAQSAP